MRWNSQPNPEDQFRLLDEAFGMHDRIECHYECENVECECKCHTAHED